MNQNIQLATLALPIGSLDAYIYRVNQIPLLSAEEELLCAKQFHDNGDLEAVRTLILAHLRYVVRVARGFLGYGLPLADLIQEGNVGLMKAVKRFDPAHGVRLVSFAVHWIKSEIHDFVIRNWRIVKIATTKAQRKLFFNLRQMKQRLGWFSQEEVQAVATDLGVAPEEVLRMEQRLNSMDVTFDAPDEEDGDHPLALAPVHYLSSPEADPLQQLEAAENGHDALLLALDGLDARAQDIIRSRFLAEDEDKLTLQDLAGKYGVSAERIRQLEKNALAKLKGVLELH